LHFKKNTTVLAIMIFVNTVIPNYSLAVSSNLEDGTQLPSREEQLRSLQQKQILVPMWGWPHEEMAEAVLQFGYEVVNAPHGNDLKAHEKEVAIWSEAGLKMLARPAFTATDPFDPDDVQRACEALAELIQHHEKHPDILGFVISWGLYGEGGFPPEFVFSEKAKESFNRHMNTPGEPLPQAPEADLPCSLRWLQWLQFRSETLVEMRRIYLAEAKKHTHKLVGTWSEMYPNENHILNMGPAPGADFVFQDLSFGHVSQDQSIAFGETHGNMQHYETFEDWRNHELPLMAKSAGEGVVPVAFQFPMRRGHHTDFLSETTVFIDEIEDEYSLRIGEDIQKLIDTVGRRTRTPEVAIVYLSYAAGALPGGYGSSFWFYQNGVRQLEGMLRQMGVEVRALPYDLITSTDLTRYKLVILPEPMYLPENVWTHLQTAPMLMLCGELFLTHHDESTVSGDFSDGWQARGVRWDGQAELQYFKAPEGKILPVANHAFFAGVQLPDTFIYPADQIVHITRWPAPQNILAEVGDYPLLTSWNEGRVIHITNRFFNHVWNADEDILERAAFQFLRNIVKEAGVGIRVASLQQRRVKEGFPYGSYGLAGYVAYNTTDQPVELTLVNGNAIIIPSFGWTMVPEM